MAEQRPEGTTPEAEELRKHVREMRALLEKVESRIGNDGRILGWSGFHMDLDALDDAAHELRAMVRQL